MKKVYQTTLILLSLLIYPFAVSTAIENQKNQHESKVVIMLGPPGSGKGTQSLELAKDLKLPHISTGDLFRENIKNNTELGKKAKAYTEKGKLVPDELVLDMLFARISEKDSASGYILDGFPRTITQAKALDAKLSGKSIIVVINLNVPDEVLVQRIVERGKMSAVKRADDTPEIAKQRLEVYHKETKPLITYYDDKHLLTNINADRPKEQVYQEILKQVNEKLALNTKANSNVNGNNNANSNANSNANANIKAKASQNNVQTSNP